MCLCVYGHVCIPHMWKMSYNHSSYKSYLNLQWWCKVPAHCRLLYGAVCVFLFEELLTGAGKPRLIKLQEGCAGITFPSGRKSHYKKGTGPGWAKCKQDCPVMSNMWCYLRQNSPGPGNGTAAGILWYAVIALRGQSWRPHSCRWEVRFPLRGGAFSLLVILRRVGSWVRKWLKRSVVRRPLKAELYHFCAGVLPARSKAIMNIFCESDYFTPSAFLPKHTIP